MPVAPGRNVAMLVEVAACRRTPHFLIHSDAGEDALLETARRLEDVYAALAGTFFAGADITEFGGWRGYLAART